MEHDEFCECEQYLKAGKEYLMAQEYEKAINEYKKALNVHLDNERAFGQMGICYEKLGDNQKALDAYDKALKINNEYKYAWGNKGALLAKMGKHGEAISCFDAAIKIDNNFSDAISNRDKAIAAEHEVEGQKSFVTNSTSPKFVVFMGPPGTGKTTVRKEKCSEGYVNIDAQDVFASLAKGQWAKWPDDFKTEMEQIGTQITKKALQERADIAFETLGSEESIIRGLMDDMLKLGYKVDVQYVHCDPVVSWERHLKAGAEDPNYVPCYYAEMFHTRWLWNGIRDEMKRSGIEDDQPYLPDRI